jgi:hypothetical protein
MCCSGPTWPQKIFRAKLAAKLRDEFKLFVSINEREKENPHTCRTSQPLQAYTIPAPPLLYSHSLQLLFSLPLAVRTMP